MLLPVLRIAVGLLLLAHATVGCVWCHTAHHVGREAAVAGAEACCDSHDGAPCQSGHDDPTKPCPLHVACQVRCIYLPTASVQLDHPLPLQGFAEGLLADQVACEGQGAMHIALSRSDGLAEPGPLPRHLLFQLLLI